MSNSTDVPLGTGTRRTGEKCPESGANRINVLALDGGGMRGLYTASVLETLARRFANGGDEIDVGKGFDLIFGTSTGAILASGLAAVERIFGF